MSAFQHVSLSAFQLLSPQSSILITQLPNYAPRRYNAPMKRLILLALLLLAACGGGQTAVPADAGEDGRLVFIEIDGGDQFLSQYSVAKGAVTRLFTVPANGWLAHAAVAPQGDRVVLSYAPPPPEGQIQFGYTHLYEMSLTADTSPTLLLPPDTPDEVFFNPVWSPDGRFLYFSHVRPEDAGAGTFTTVLQRWNVDTGEITAVAANAIWPRPSPDGTQLAYVAVNPQTQANGLVVSRADGSEPRQLVPEDAFQVVDVPVFSPDGQWLYFSAAQNATSGRSWWEWLLGVQVAAAHNIPSDWYRIPLQGGVPERLTFIDGVNLFGLFAPDGETLFFTSASGLQQMQPDGTGIRRLTETAAAPSLSWQP